MRRAIARSFVLSIAITALSGCQAFFTTSLASSLARESVAVPADISNEDAAALLAGNPSEAMLESLLATLNDQVLTAPENVGSAALAAEAAIGVSGVSEIVMSTVADALETSTLPTDITALVTALQAGAAATGVVMALDRLSAPEVRHELEPTELVVAAVLLATSALADNNIDISDPENPTGDLSAYQADPDVALALILVQDAAAALPEGSAGASITDMLAGFFPME